MFFLVKPKNFFMNWLKAVLLKRKAKMAVYSESDMQNQRNSGTGTSTFSCKAKEYFFVLTFFYVIRKKIQYNRISEPE